MKDQGLQSSWWFKKQPQKSKGQSVECGIRKIRAELHKTITSDEKGPKTEDSSWPCIILQQRSKYIYIYIHLVCGVCVRVCGGEGDHILEDSMLQGKLRVAVVLRIHCTGHHGNQALPEESKLLACCWGFWIHSDLSVMILPALFQPVMKQEESRVWLSLPKQIPVCLTDHSLAWPTSSHNYAVFRSFSYPAFLSSPSLICIWSSNFD